MSYRQNESTNNRPEGERILDAPWVLSDVLNYMEMLKEEKAWIENDRNAITAFKSPELTIVITILKGGASMPDIVSDGLMTILIVNGIVDLSVGDRQKDAGQGFLSVIHPGMKYAITAKEECTLIFSHFSVGNTADKVI